MKWNNEVGSVIETEEEFHQFISEYAAFHKKVMELPNMLEDVVEEESFNYRQAIKAWLSIKGNL